MNISIVKALRMSAEIKGQTKKLLVNGVFIFLGYSPL